MSDINVCNFNETLINDVVSFEQPGPGNFQTCSVSVILLLTHLDDSYTNVDHDCLDLS